MAVSLIYYRAGGRPLCARNIYNVSSHSRLPYRQPWPPAVVSNRIFGIILPQVNTARSGPGISEELIYFVEGPCKTEIEKEREKEASTAMQLVVDPSKDCTTLYAT